MKWFKSSCAALAIIGLLESAQADNLLKHYRDALEHDAQFLAARALSQAGDEESILGLAGLLPNLSLDAQSNWSQAQYETFGGSLEHRRQSRSYGVQLRQPVFRWQSWVHYQQGKQQKAFARLQLGIAAQALILRVAKAYFDVLITKEVLDVLSRLREVDAEQLAGAKKHFELGNVSITDVHEAQASLDLVSARIIVARSKAGLARHELSRITGSPVGELRGLTGGVGMVLPQPADANDWVTSAERNSLEVQAQEVLLDIARNEVRSRKAEHLPSLDLVASKSMQQNPSVGTERGTTATIGLRMSMPLYAGGGTSAAVRKAKALAAKAEYELEDAKGAAALLAREAWAGVIDGVGQVRALEAAKISAESALAANRLGYKIGVRIGRDVLEMQSQYSDTLQRLSSARYDTLLAKLRLKAAVGALSEEDLVEVNLLLDEQA
ncbi:TolC family outer membrane protein [Pseudomonas sp. LS1212]|uniref:TolC family outer membrane protein n=1 Tax=Pseudomonas sp. LS1212 TaxID=2972478 RepID=UPI00215B7F39|nr:TolC family outer membrane protein [Pseudomonas sp. LS1212]UVJ44499.1 TolC family outer membrane protein [Pseudomonas sp. LS1212]